MTAWTTPIGVRAAVQREWDSGRLLAARISGPHRRTEFPFAVRLRGPRSTELASRFDEVQAWAAALAAKAGGYRLEYRDAPSRTLGTQKLPAAAWLDTIEDAVRLIGTVRETRVFDGLVADTPPQYLDFAAAKPLTLLAVSHDWPQITSVATWLAAHPRPGVFVRQVDLPGVHTKVIEQHKRLIAALVGPGEPAAGPEWFERSYGFATKPALIRFRALDPASAPLPGLTDVTLPVAEFSALPTHLLRRVFVTENEINFLAFPEVPEAVVVFGVGNEAPERLGAVPWLHDVAVHYWGDIDTHGFAILDRFRNRLPHAASLLMDGETLLAHRSSWGSEPSQVRRDLPSLTDEEAAVYATLLDGSLGDRVRLEQEFVSFGAVQDALAALR